MRSKSAATSPTGWWIAGLLERRKDGDRVIYWNNYRLYRARDWREAFHKAAAHGKCDSEVGRKAFDSAPEFLGVTDLVPIYDEFEEGAEVLWQEYEGDPESPGEMPLEVYTEAEMEELYQVDSET